MTSVMAADILRDQASFESDRFQFDTTNQRIADLIWPASSLFLNRDQMQGQRRDQFSFDSTGALAIGRFSAAVESILTPRTQKWHTMRAADPELAKLTSVKKYCEQLTDTLFRARYSPRSGFTYASGEHYMSLGAFGNGCTFLDEDVGRDLRYQSIFFGDVWIGTNHAGMVDRVHRKFELTARQAMGKFADPGERIRKAVEKSPEQKFEFIHCVKPRQDYDRGRRDFRGMRYASYYLTCADRDIIDEGGYRSMPYLFSRFSTAPRETYGRGPASVVLPTLNTINEQSKTLLRAGQRALDPPIMMVDDDALETFNLKSGALNRGYLDGQGNALAVPFQQNGNMPIGLEMIQDSRHIINDAFFVSLFQILIEQPQMTATEALLRAQEKGELLGPSVGRQQSEYCDPMIQRELGLLSQVPRLLPEMPPELQEAGGVLATQYTSPLDRMQQAGDGAAMLRWVEAATPVAQFKPEVLDGINWNKWGRKLADIQGVPAEVQADEAEQEEATAAQAEQAQMAQLLQAAPLAGKAALDLTRAQEIANAQPTAGVLL